jgi:hypothetical protein
MQPAWSGAECGAASQPGENPDFASLHPGYELITDY